MTAIGLIGFYALEVGLGLPRVASDAAIAATSQWAGSEVLGPCLVPFGAPSGELAEWAGRVAADALGWDEVFAPFADKLRADLNPDDRPAGGFDDEVDFPATVFPAQVVQARAKVTNGQLRPQLSGGIFR